MNVLIVEYVNQSVPNNAIYKGGVSWTWENKNNINKIKIKNKNKKQKK